MMNDSAFEIKVALIGYVSVGKTTVVNALFREKYSEVSMRRTTAGVSNFRIHVRGSDGGGPAPMDVDYLKDSKSTLEEITADNQRLRQEDSEVEQKTFDIKLDKHLCEMREDTMLTVVDVPGINEAGASSKYKKFVQDNWHTFDCAVVVTDARQGVNTEEQMNLLRFVKGNLDSIKELPVIVLCNKVDEPEDEEQQVLVKEAREALEQIFSVSNRTVALERLLNQNAKSGSRRSLFPVFIPVSAIHAFIYQSGSRLTLEEFSKLDQDLVEKLGREHYGKMWRRMGKKEKIKKAFAVVSDKVQYREGLEDSNFDKFLAALAYCVGGKETQGDLLGLQLEIASSRLSPMGSIVSDLRVIFRKCQALDKTTRRLPTRFWELYKQAEDLATESFTASPRKIDSLATPMNHLLSFLALSREIGWDTDAEVREAAKKLIRVQVVALMKQWDTFRTGRHWKFDSSKAATWNSVSMEDWATITGSVLLFAGDRHVAVHLGREKLMLEKIRLEQIPTANGSRQSCPLCSSLLSNHPYHQQGPRVCSQCHTIFYRGEKPRHVISPSNGQTMKVSSNNKWKDSDVYNGRNNGRNSTTWTLWPEELKLRLQNGEWVPVDQAYYQAVVGFEVPAGGPSDSTHFGHLMYQFCRLMDKIES